MGAGMSSMSSSWASKRASSGGITLWPGTLLWTEAAVTAAAWDFGLGLESLSYELLLLSSCFILTTLSGTS